MIDEDLGTVTGYTVTLSPAKDGGTLQIGTVIIGSHQEARCDVDLDGNVTVLYVVNKK